MDEFKVPIYLMTGFLESGKTSFLNFTLAQEYFQIDEPTLLILCEEGEEEYDKKVLKKSRTSVEVIDSIEELTTERLVAYDAFYNPGRVIIEYNGMWQVSKLEELTFPSGWGIEQHIVTVDASTFQVYLNNMKSLFMEMVRNADLVLFNRADTELPLANFRRSIKVVNPGAELILKMKRVKSRISLTEKCHLMSRPRRLKFQMRIMESGIWMRETMRILITERKFLLPEWC